MAEVKRTYYKNGELESECFTINNKRNGEYKLYYGDGRRLSKDNHMRENVSSANFLGQFLEIRIYMNDNMNGEYKWYHTNGQLKSICTYIDNKRNGTYKKYKDNGDTIEQSIWMNGVKIE